MKLWIDDVRPAPEGWCHCRSVHEGKVICCQHLKPGKILHIEVMSFDHEAGDYASMGGDYIELLNWLERRQELENWNIITEFHFHSANPVGIANMRRIIQRNGWKEIR